MSFGIILLLPRQSPFRLAKTLGSSPLPLAFPLDIPAPRKAGLLDACVEQTFIRCLCWQAVSSAEDRGERQGNRGVCVWRVGEVLKSLCLRS